MSMKEINDAIEGGKICFGIKQAVRNYKKDDNTKIFVVRDARDAAIKLLEDNEVGYGVLKKRSDVKKALKLNFDCEVFSIIN